MRHLINTNPGRNQILEGAGSECLFQAWPAGCHYIALSLCVNVFKCSLNVVIRSTVIIFTSFALLLRLKVAMIWWMHVEHKEQQRLCSAAVLRDKYFPSAWRVATNRCKKDVAV